MRWARRRRKLEWQLRQCTVSGRFAIAYQPLVDARFSEVIGYEALLRLNDEVGMPVPTTEFIPLAEEIDLIEEIGEWVLFHAMKEIADLDDVSSVSIDLSIEQFKSGKPVDTVKAAMAASGLTADRLELEIAKNLLLQNEAHAEYQIDALKEMGIRIAMDDFGTGFSSLSTLWRYGFERIEIDKSFIQALDEAPDRSPQLIDAIVTLGARMDMSIAAEGIEMEDQRRLLAQLGCDAL